MKKKLFSKKKKFKNAELKKEKHEKEKKFLIIYNNFINIIRSSINEKKFCRHVI